MHEPPLPTGKLAPGLLNSLLRRRHPAPPEVLLGPQIGEDGCALSVPAGVLVAAADPITMTGNDVGRHAVLVNANDVAVMGVRPRWFLATVMLPPGTRAADARALFGGMLDALDTLGIELVGGHTEVTDAVRMPVVSGQMLGVSPDGHFVRTGGLRPGDRVVQVGPAPVEGAALLADRPEASTLPVEVRRAAGAALAEPGIVVVEPALKACALGATALHDPTEGGLSAGLHELAAASGVGLSVATREVLWFEPGTALSRALGLDPWGVLASGTLLAGFPGDRASQAVRALRRAGYLASIIAEASDGAGVRVDGGRPLPHFERDELSRLG